MYYFEVEESVGLTRRLNVHYYVKETTMVDAQSMFVTHTQLSIILILVKVAGTGKYVNLM